MGECLQIYVQYLYPCGVLVGEGLQIYVQNLYPIRKGRGGLLTFSLLLLPIFSLGGDSGDLVKSKYPKKPEYLIQTASKD